MEKSLSIFIEALWDASILPYGNQNSFYAVTSFGDGGTSQAILLAVPGSVFGYVINWFLGGWMVKFGLSKQSDTTQANYAKAQAIAQKLAWVGLLLIWIPLGNYITFLAGFFKVRLQVLLAVSIPVITAYYIVQAGVI